MIENSGHIHAYSSGVGSDNSFESKVFKKYKSFVNLVICCNFIPSNYVQCNSFSTSNTQATTFGLAVQ